MAAPRRLRRLLRAVALGLAVFLFVGGGVGFVVAANEGGDSGLSVPLPGPGDRAVYSVRKTLLPNLELGDAGDIMLDEVVHEWLPEDTASDRSFQELLVQPLQSTYIYRWNGGEARYTYRTDYDAATGEPVRRLSGGQYTTQPLLLPGVIGQVGAGIDPLLQPPSEVHFASDSYAWFMHVPCGQRTPLHGAGGLPSGPVSLGSCGWPGDDGPVYEPGDWEDLRSGRAMRFEAAGQPLLEAWFDSASPFPAKLTASMTETVYEPWTVGRLFTLERTAWARGEAPYPVREPAVPAPRPVPIAPHAGPWLLDDTGLDAELPLATAYATAEAAPRATSRTGTAGLTRQGQQQPTVKEWLALHPDGYLGDAERYESVDRYGQRNPGWVLLWVDGNGAWLGKRVSYEATTDGPVTVFLPEASGRRLVVSDWTPKPTQRELLELVASFPDSGQVPAKLPRAADIAGRFLEGSPSATGITYYGFRAFCGETDCAEAGIYAWAGQSTSTFDPNTGATGGNASQSQLSVDGDGLALLRYRQTHDAAPVLGLGAPSSADTPPAAAAAAGPGAWTLPSTPAATTGIGLVAAIAGLLYYFWPALKGGPLVGLFSRIRSDKVLDHPQRARLLDAIQADPGVHFQELARRLGLGHGVLDHHLRKLMDADLVLLRRAPGYTCYFPKATDRRMMDAAPMLRSGGSRAVLGAVAERPGVSSRDLASHLGLAPSTVSYHLKRLETAGLVLPDPRAGVRLTPLGEQAKAAA
jgi:DNA-binding transcriptional ArsR family regulator